MPKGTKPHLQPPPLTPSSEAARRMNRRRKQLRSRHKTEATGMRRPDKREGRKRGRARGARERQTISKKMKRARLARQGADAAGAETTATDRVCRRTSRVDGQEKNVRPRPCHSRWYCHSVHRSSGERHDGTIPSPPRPSDAPKAGDSDTMQRGRGQQERGCPRREECQRSDVERERDTATGVTETKKIP